VGLLISGVEGPLSYPIVRGYREGGEVRPGEVVVVLLELNLKSSGDRGGVMGATLCREKKGESGLTIQSPLWFSPDRSGGVEGSASLACFSFPGLGGGLLGRVRLLAGQRTMAGRGSILRVELEMMGCEGVVQVGC
jgi:hypothetical protein